MISGILILLLLTSCKEEEQISIASFSVKNKQILSSELAKKMPVKNLNDGEFSFSEVLIGLSDISLESGIEENNSYEIKFSDTYVFDVLNGMSDPDLVPVAVEAGRYHQLKVSLDNTLDSEKSLSIKGSWLTDNLEYDFEFSSDLVTELSLENELGIEIGFDERVNFVLVLPLEELFRDVDFSKLDFDNDKVIRINKWSNRDLKAVLEHKLLEIVRFGKDD